MNIKNLGKECGFWFQVNLETEPPILVVSNPKIQKQEFVFGKLNKYQEICFDSKKFIESTTIGIDEQNNVYWFKNERLHRKDGPARVWANGAKEWFRNGEHHREDGPAVVHSDGSEFWYKNGELHREDGPAIVRSDGTKEWWLSNKQYFPTKENNNATSDI